jgi:AcrR family transcriptional regulator
MTDTTQVNGSLTSRPRRATRGRPPAMPDEELRRRMFAAAGEMLTEAGGFTLSFEQINLESIMRRADVSRSAVYRVWPTKEDFNFELLDAFASIGPGGVEPFDADGQSIARTLVAERPELLETTEGRRTLLMEAIRRVANQDFQAIIQTRRWRRYAVLTIAADGMDEERAEHILGTMRATEETFYTGYIEFYRSMFELLKLRPRAPFTDADAYEALTRMTVALFHGLSMQHTVNTAVGDTTYLGAGGDWTLPSLGFLAIVDAVSEPVLGGQ